MPTPSDAVRLLVGGLAHDDWDAYEVDSDLLIPADAWRVALSLRSGELPSQIVEGAPVEVRVGDDLVMSGRIDEITDDESKAGIEFSISGRDGAAVLLDCSAAIFVAQMVSLADVVAKIVRPLGVTKIDIRADSTRLREKINVEPGEMAWEVLTRAAEANGLWPWFEPDGTLVIGGPDYDKAPVATLIMRKSGKGNNVIRLTRRRSIQGRYSVVTVLGQRRGTSIETGKHALKASEPDAGVSWYRPRITVDYEADSEAVCRSRARKLLSDSRLKSLTWQATVQGHRIAAPGQPADGLLWSPGQRIHLISERRGVDATFFLMARRFTGGRATGPRTLLTLKEDRAWVLDAHPHKKKHRAKKDEVPLQILDASKGAAQ